MEEKDTRGKEAISMPREIISIHDHYRTITPMYADEYLELFDQLEFENSMESLDKLMENDSLISSTD